MGPTIGKPRFPLERWALVLGFLFPHWTAMMYSIYPTWALMVDCYNLPSMLSSTGRQVTPSCEIELSVFRDFWKLI